MSNEIDTFLTALFDKNRALFGDTRMDASTPPPEEKGDAADKGSDGEKPEEKPEEKDGVKALPDWAQKELADTRAEAANYRTQLREAQTKLAEAKTPEEVAAAISELQQKNAELERTVLVTSVARKHSLPSELAELLKGDDEAALEAHAKVLAKFIPGPGPGSLEGGLTPADDPDNETDPRKLAARISRRR